MFSRSIIKELQHYVYLYLNPETDEIFYVGKGKGNRVFEHLEDDSETEKVRIIKELQEKGLKPKIEILIHGLSDEETAYKVEAAVIDLIGKENLTNKVRGWRSGTYGRTAIDELIALYQKEEVEIEEPTMLIRINQLFRYGMSDVELYDATRGVWRVGEDREKVKLAMAIYEGVIKEVYEIVQWFQAGSTFTTRKGEWDGDRWEFVGKIADETLRKKYRNKYVGKYFKKNAQYPNIYVNVKNS